MFVILNNWLPEAFSCNDAYSSFTSDRFAGNGGIIAHAITGNIAHFDVKSFVDVRWDNESKILKSRSIIVEHRVLFRRTYVHSNLVMLNFNINFVIKMSRRLLLPYKTFTPFYVFFCFCTVQTDKRTGNVSNAASRAAAQKFAQLLYASKINAFDHDDDDDELTIAW